MAMKLGRKRETPPPTVYVGDHTDKLSRIRPIVHDEDERQSREDYRYGETLFNRSPVPLPRIFRRGGNRAG
jgi:hypothetical protein